MLEMRTYFSTEFQALFPLKAVQADTARGEQAGIV